MNIRNRVTKLEAGQNAAANGESLADRLRRARERYERGELRPYSESETRALIERLRGRA